MATCCYGSLPKSQIGSPYILGSICPERWVKDGLDRLDGSEPISKCDEHFLLTKLGVINHLNGKQSMEETMSGCDPVIPFSHINATSR